MMIQKHEEINSLTNSSDNKNSGEVRTNVHCHECGKTFIAELDFDINGAHIIVCPYCEHEHCRTIKDGIITGDRWDGRNDKKIPVDRRNIWTTGVVSKIDDKVISGARTSTVAKFIRELWLNGKDLNV